MKRFFLISVSLVALSLCSSAATYFASPSGTGDGLSYASPTSFAAGVAKLTVPGDTLYLLGGTYEFTDKFSINKQGSSSKYIVISGYPGEKAILDFHRVSYGTRGITVHANSLYVHIKDLAIAWSGKNNLYNEGSYCLFENLDIYGSADTGCQMKKGGNNVILNVDSHDNFDYKTMSGAQANFGGNADGFADKQFTGAGNHYIGCRAWNNSDDGWDFFQRVSSSNTIIENCVCYQNGMPYYDMSHNPRALGVDKPWFDSKVGTQMTDRYGQTITITLDRYPCQGNGNGFKMGGQYTDHKILIHHSLAVANNARGFDQNNNGGTMWVYNNTGYDNGVNFGTTMESTSVSRPPTAPTNCAITLAIKARTPTNPVRRVSSLSTITPGMVSTSRRQISSRSTRRRSLPRVQPTVRCRRVPVCTSRTVLRSSTPVLTSTSGITASRRTWAATRHPESAMIPNLREKIPSLPFNPKAPMP